MYILFPEKISLFPEKISLFPLISWFVLYLILQAFTNQNAIKSMNPIIFTMFWECSPMARETWVQSKVESYQRLKKWYLMPPYLTLSIIRFGSRVNLGNPGKGGTPFPTSWCSSYRKGSLRITPRLRSPTLLTYWSNSTTTVLQRGWLWHEVKHES